MARSRTALTTTKTDLETFAEGANREHAAAMSALQTALEHAKAAGEWLVKAKGETTKTGVKWAFFVKHHLTYAESTANTYVRISENWPLIVDHFAGKGDPAKLKDVSVARAIKLIRQRDENKTRGGTKLDKLNKVPETNRGYEWTIRAMLARHKLNLSVETAVAFLKDALKCDEAEIKRRYADWKEFGF